MTRVPQYRDDLRNLIATEAAPVYKFGHQARLHRLALQIGAEITYDSDVVFAAIWLHDIGVFEGNRPANLEDLLRWDHVRYATERAIDVLSKTDFPSDKIGRVVAVIEEHQPKDVPTSVEAMIVRDADILEQLGMIAVLRAAGKLGSDTRFQRLADVKEYLERQLSELPSKLELPKARELATDRQKSLREFLSHLEGESGNELDQ